FGSNPAQQLPRFRAVDFAAGSRAHAISGVGGWRAFVTNKSWRGILLLIPVQAEFQFLALVVPAFASDSDDGHRAQRRDSDRASLEAARCVVEPAGVCPVPTVRGALGRWPPLLPCARNALTWKISWRFSLSPPL